MKADSVSRARSGFRLAAPIAGRADQDRRRRPGTFRNDSNRNKDMSRMREANGGATLRIDSRGVVKWTKENAITIALFGQLIDDRRVDQCVAFQQADGWFIVLAKLSRERDVRYLATFRELAKPRRFSRLDVLFKLLHDTLGYNGVIQVLPYSRAAVAKRLEKL
jgi:hypothetical protein